MGARLDRELAGEGEFSWDGVTSSFRVFFNQPFMKRDNYYINIILYITFKNAILVFLRCKPPTEKVGAGWEVVCILGGTNDQIPLWTSILDEVSRSPNLETPKQPGGFLRI